MTKNIILILISIICTVNCYLYTNFEKLCPELIFKFNGKTVNGVYEMRNVSDVKIGYVKYYFIHKIEAEFEPGKDLEFAKTIINAYQPIARKVLQENYVKLSDKETIYKDRKLIQEYRNSLKNYMNNELEKGWQSTFFFRMIQSVNLTLNFLDQLYDWKQELFGVSIRSDFMRFRFGFLKYKDGQSLIIDPEKNYKDYYGKKILKITDFQYDIPPTNDGDGQRGLIRFSIFIPAYDKNYNLNDENCRNSSSLPTFFTNKGEN